MRSAWFRLLDHLPACCPICGRWPAPAICPACIARFAAHRPRCPQCAAPLPQANGHCGACLTRQMPAALDRCVAAVDYGYPWDRLIARFKFQGEPGWAGPFARLLLATPDARPLLTACDLIVPVPLTPQRLAERGYNQAWELAKALRRRSHAPAAPGVPQALVRLGDAPDQHRLPRTQRLRNLRGAFAAHPRHAPALRGARVLLVDDVTTTGTTLATAAQAVLQAGAASVSALVLARTPAPAEG